MRLFARSSGGRAKAPRKASKGKPSKSAPPAPPLLTTDQVIDLIGWLLLAIAVITLLSAVSASQGTLTGAWIGALRMTFGLGMIGAPLLLAAMAIYLLVRHFGEHFPPPSAGVVVGVLLGYASALGLLHALSSLAVNVPYDVIPADGRGGGTAGWAVFQSLSMVGSVGAMVLLVMGLFMGVIMITGRTVAQVVIALQQWLGDLRLRLTGRRVVTEGGVIVPRYDPQYRDAENDPGEDGLKINGLKPVRKPARTFVEERAEPEQEPEPAPIAPVAPARPKETRPDLKINVGSRATAPAEFTPSTARKAPPPRVIGEGLSGPAAAPGLTLASEPTRAWTLPAMTEILEVGKDVTLSESDIKDRARLIEETLYSFGVPAKVTEVNRGPTITQYGVEPGFTEMKNGKQQKVKVSRISALADDLALALAAPRIRIEAPVPGRSIVGIEVPNGETALVSLRDVMESDEFVLLERKTRLRLALGQDVSGHPVAKDLTSMPHMLIAGTTGSGKSVCVNSIITALLIENSPEHLRMLMVDPKRVELTGYNGIPHLIAPVVVDLEQVTGVLKWVTSEMDRRYRVFARYGARNIADFNARVEERKTAGPAKPGADDPDLKQLPFIVVFIDELADLMMMAPDEIEKTICRLAQMARATGIHLILATQRPSVDVVTGLIKANFPARIAFTVASAIDSRVILDTQGAEKLLGRGDMLVLTPETPAPIRAQGCFLSDVEIQRVVRHWRAQAAGGAPSGPIVATQLKLPIAERPMDEAGLPNSAPPWATPADPQDVPDFAALTRSDNPEGGNSGSGDNLFDDAVATVRLQGKASISLLQRRLRIGYTRSARMIEEMEEKGIVGPSLPGSQFREVLPPKDQDPSP